MLNEPLPPAERSAITAAAEARSPSLRGMIREHYDSLLELARGIHAKEGPGAPHSPTSLVHEAFLRLVHQPDITARGKLFFRACFAQEFRRIQVDAVRRRRALRRGGGVVRESIADQSGLSVSGTVDLLELDEAMEILTRLDPDAARVAEWRVFGDLTIAQCAELLGVSSRTVDTVWAFARSWLQNRLR